MAASPREYLRHVAFGHAWTDLARWSLATSFDSGWDGRTILMARHLRAGDKVAEFGAGMQALRKVLPEGCTYQPFDLVARTTDTCVCDLNMAYPDLSGNYDVAVFSGVLEYLRDLPSTFRWLGGCFERVVFSYAVSEMVPSPLTRNRHGWVNNLSRQELIDLANAQGFSCRVVDTWKNHVVFVAEKP
jgi:hypothetical protein